MSNTVSASLAKMWVKEWIMFSVYPQGWMGEFERWTSTNPMKGMTYAGTTLTQPLTIATLLARTGDYELLDWTTTAGHDGQTYLSSSATAATQGTAGPVVTEGDPDIAGQGKSLRFACRFMARYAKGFYDRYGTNSSTNNGDPNYLLWWGTPTDVGEYMGTEALWWADANRYWNDTLLQEVSDANATGMKPQSEISEYEQGFRLSGYHGDGHGFPSVLFMHHKMTANPYGGGA